MGQNGFAGLVNSSDRRIVVVDDHHHARLVLVEGRPYMRWPADDILTQRIAIAQLYQLHMGSREEIAAAFHISTSSTSTYIRRFAAKGSSGLVGKKGPKSKWKINPSVRGKILWVFLKDGIVDYEQIKEKLAAWEEQVGITSIRQVLIENGLVREVSVFSELANAEGLFHTEDSDEQLRFQFRWAEEEDEETECAEARSVPTAGQQKRENAFARAEARAKRYYSSGQRMYLDQLKQGSYNSYAGGLLFTPFLSHYPLSSTVGSIIEVPAQEGYSLEELCQTLFYFDVFGFRSMEDFKRAYPEEFGLLIGRASSPSHFTLRRFLHTVRQLAKSEALIDAFAAMYLKSGIAKWGVLYIDAHFLPYSGMYPITKGWHGVRQMAMKGSYHFIGVDEKFSPWIFLVRSSSEDLLQKILS